MANLTRRNKSTLEKYLKMEGGYVLDFSNRTFAEFFEDFGIDIEAEVYTYGSGSKANRLRGFWDVSDEATIGKVLLGLIDHYDEERANSFHGSQNHSDEMRTKCVSIANMLMSGSYNTAANGPSVHINSAVKAQENQQSAWPHNQNIQQSIQPAQQPQFAHSPFESIGGTHIFNQAMAQNKNQSSVTKQKVFIVHGHDEVVRLKIENFVRKIGLEPIVLMDQASGGNTIIEKIEEYSAVDYAIVLYTPCDEGRNIGTNELKGRARQNVVFEHGYFIASLGRNKVAAIVKQGVEIQNDIQGVVYIGFDAGWETQLLREFHKAELKFDANALYA